MSTEIAPTHPYVIRFDDERCIGGYHDIEYLDQDGAEKGWANIIRKKSKTSARLYIKSKLESQWRNKP